MRIESRTPRTRVHTVKVTNRRTHTPTTLASTRTHTHKDGNNQSVERSVAVELTQLKSGDQAHVGGGLCHRPRLSWKSTNLFSEQHDSKQKSK